MEKYIGPIELDNGDYLEIVQDGDVLIGGSVCNIGLLPHYKYKMDTDFSLDENLQEFLEDMNEAELGDDGSYTDSLFWVRSEQ